ncbi:MAG: maleylpyruvate isomerase N-terminal domain-containing protein [Acidimicrobiales bacterium]
MPASVARSRVHDLYRSGVDAVRTTTTDFDHTDWQAPGVGDWSNADVARHMLAVSRWYHHWLDRALDGATDPPFPADQLDVRNRDELEQLADVDGPSAIELFVESADRYLVRVDPHWEVVYGFPFGTVTAGLHAGVAASEWHLHAWDLSRTDRRHQPADPEGLFLAAGACLSEAEGGIKGAVVARVVPLVARRNPWPSLLRRSGRDPG